MADSTHHESHIEGKCLCPYCSGSIGRGMRALNEKNVAECDQLVEAYGKGQREQFDQMVDLLDSLNPVQCFDALDKLCSQSSPTQDDRSLDELILKYVQRFRTNGGFFLALKEPGDRRQHLLQRLTDHLLTNSANAEKTNLTAAEINA